MSAQSFNFSNAKVLVVGDSGLDEYWHGTTNRISPEAPVAVSHYKTSEYRLAGAAQVAAILQSIGAKNSLISCVGSDKAASHISRMTELLDQFEVKSHLEPVGTNTSHIIRVVSQAQQLLKVDNSQYNLIESGGEKIHDAIKAHSKDYNSILLFNNGKGFFSLNDYQKYLAQDYIQERTKKIIYFASNLKAILDFINSDLVVDYLIIDHKIYTECGSELADKFKQGLFIIEYSNKQKSIKYTTKEDFANSQFSIEIKQNYYHNEVDDLIGVQEVVAALISASISLENNIAFTAELALSAMNYVLRKFGQSVVNIVELQLAYADYLLKGKYNYLKLQQEINAARKQGNKIVFANGCFDVLHVGHIAYLDAASRRGDKLFVAINSDDSIRALKGPNRPVNLLADRIKSIVHLKSVDWVVPFFTETPEDFLRWLKPDVLVKGGDYTIDGVVGREIVYEYGGKVDIVKHPYTEISSTKIIQSQMEQSNES